MYSGFVPATVTLHCPFSLPRPPCKQVYLGFPQANAHLLQFIHFLFSFWPLVLFLFLFIFCTICNLMASHSSSKFSSKNPFSVQTFYIFSTSHFSDTHLLGTVSNLGAYDSANPDAVTLGKSLALSRPHWKSRKEPNDHSTLFSQNIKLGYSGATQSPWATPVRQPNG